MTKHFLIALALACTQTLAAGQTTQPTPQPTQTTAPARPSGATPLQRQPRAVDLSEYGVDFAPDQRLLVVMAALDVAGFDPTKTPSVFRAQLRQDQAALDPELRQRMQRFYELHKLPGSHTPAEQAARYV